MKVLIFTVLFGLNHLGFAGDNQIEKNVNIVPAGATYKNDFDTSKFRLGVMNSNFNDRASNRELASLSSISKHLKNRSTALCDAVKNVTSRGFKSSSAYVVSVLKQAGAIPLDDKEYSLKSSHFFWELYLGYRNFVDLSKPIRLAGGTFTKSMIPQGAILNVEKDCNQNGATAVFCDGKYYTTKFVDEKKLFSRINDPSDKRCKLGRGLRVIVEAGRLVANR